MIGPTELSNIEIDRYSIRKRITDELVAAGWTDTFIDLVDDNWPVGASIVVPGIYIQTDDNENAGYELGTDGRRLEVFVNIYGANDADRWRLSEALMSIFRRLIPIYEYVDGSELDPPQVGYLDTEDVDYRPIKSLATTPDAERWRSVVHATLLREDS